MATFRGAPKWIWDIPRDVWPYTFQVDYDRYVVPRRGSVAWYINHSCEPTCLISGRSVVTAREIRAGEELTFDYSTDVDWPRFRMPCACGSDRCRRVAKAYRFLPMKLKLEYAEHVAPYITKAYRIPTKTSYLSRDETRGPTVPPTSDRPPSSTKGR